MMAVAWCRIPRFSVWTQSEISWSGQLISDTKSGFVGKSKVKENQDSKQRTVLIIYTIIFYGLWSLLELYLKTKIGIDEFTKEVYIKCVLWLIPAILIHFGFSDRMFSKKEEMSILSMENLW